MQARCELRGLPHQPTVAREQINLIAWPVGMVRHSGGVVRNGAPEVGYKAIGVVDGLDALSRVGSEQHGGAACEGFDVVVDPSKRGPYG